MYGLNASICLTGLFLIVDLKRYMKEISRIGMTQNSFMWDGIAKHNCMEKLRKTWYPDHNCEKK